MTLITTIVAGLVLASAPDPARILADADKASSRAKDAVLDLQVSVSSSGSTPLVRELRVWQLGADRRLVKFLAPARLRGIGILVPKQGQTYLYHPSRNKIRRIVGKGGGASFEGTGFSISDLSRVRFSADYSAALTREDTAEWVLRLSPKDPDAHAHAALTVHVRKSDHLVAKVVTLDSAGKALRTIAATEVRQVGAYPLAHRIEIVDHKTGKRTLARVSTAKFDTGLGPRDFTERQLRRIY